MSTPKFEPRRFALDPEAFGKARELEWNEVDRANQVRLKVAQMHHQWAYTVRSDMKRGPMSAKTLSTASRIPYDRLMKVLRGEILLTLETVMSIDVVFRRDFRLLPTPGARTH